MGAGLSLLLVGGTGGSTGSPVVENRLISSTKAYQESPRILKRFGPSNLIVDQVPDFINKDHQSFRAFVEAYYEWLEQYQNAFGIVDSFTESTDIDRTIGLFFSEFRFMYLNGFPYQLAFDSSGNVIDEANFLKNVRNFYGAKGTEKAFRFLFRLIYNVASEVRYPSSDVLKCSHGKWTQRQSIRMTNSGGTANYLMSGNQVFQYDDATSKVSASAIVTDVIQYNRQYYSVNEVFIKDVFGTFKPNKPIYCKVNAIVLSEIIFPVVEEISILDGGYEYQQSDKVIVTNYGDGLGLHAVVDVVNNKGTIKTVSIIDSGVGYGEETTALVVSNSGNGAARLQCIIGAIANYSGYYSGNDGKLSSNKKLFDGSYYQDFSYVLRSEISFDRYREMYKKLVHPAGFKMFGEILIKRNIVDSIPFHSEMQRYEVSLIGHYTPYRMGTTADLYPLYTSGFNPRGTTYSTYQSYGSSGGKLMIEATGGFTFDNSITWASIRSRGSASNGITASVFEFAKIGETYAAIYLKTIDFDTASGSVLGSGFVEGNTMTMITTSGAGYTAYIRMVRNGLGIVPEFGGFTHSTQELPLGSSGADGYIEAQGFSYSYWGIYHHPNTRGIKGLTGMWNGSTGSGSSMGSIALKRFMKMPIGYHFHSNSNGTPYQGTTGTENEYGLIESTTLTSPNF